MAISKHLVFSVVIFLVGFLLASSHPADNRLSRPRPPPSRPPPPRRPPSPPPPRPRSPPPPSPSPPPPTPSPPPPSPPPKPQPGFDYFKLALQWPHSVCFASYMCKPTEPKQQYFTIHGLWPQKNNGGQLRDCDTNYEMTDDILKKSKFKDDLLEYWPNLLNINSSKLWKDQWKKHGSCSSNKFLPEAYLDITIQLGKKYGPLITKKMEEKGIKPSRTTLDANAAKQTLDAIKDVTDTTALIICSKPDELDPKGILQLYEIHLCVEADGKTLQNCKGGNPQGRCSKGFIFPPPWNTTIHSRLPSFLSSLLDVEEAVGI